jgi:hypothetical protein
MENHIPKVGDTARLTEAGWNAMFMVIRINTENKTADLESLPTSADSYVLASVAWNAISFELGQSNRREIPLVMQSGHAPYCSSGRSPTRNDC